MELKTRKSFLFILILCAILFSYFPALLHAQTFNYKKTITIDHTKVSAALTNFPVLVSIANDNDLKNHVTSANGYDLIFEDSGGGISYGYDAPNRLIWIYYPDGRMVMYTYDSAGNRTKLTSR